MKITIQITVESDDGQLNVAQEVAHLDRGTLMSNALNSGGWPMNSPDPIRKLDVLQLCSRAKGRGR